MRAFKTLLIIILISLKIASAQNTMHSWQNHFAGKNAKAIALTQKNILVACEQMIYSYNYNIINKSYTKLNGLNDADIKLIHNLPKSDKQIIVYENSNIDILNGNATFNFSALKNKQISADKKIYHIANFNDEEIWLSCGFGIVTFDTKKLEFKNTYYIGNNGNFVKVLKTAFTQNYAYAVTSEGLKRASLNTSNLNDFNSWKNVALPANQKPIAIEIINGTIYLSLTNNLKDNKGGTVYFSKNNSWKIFTPQYDNIKKISQTKNYLNFITADGKAYIHTKDGFLWHECSKYTNPPQPNGTPNINQIKESPEGDIYIADARYSLVQIMPNDTYKFIAPKTPFTNNVAELKIINRDLVGVAGGMKINLHPSKIEASLFRYNLDNKTYKNTVIFNHQDFCTVISPNNNSNDLFIGSWNSGLFQISGDKLIDRFYDGYSSLQNIVQNYASVRIGGLCYDGNNNLYMTNSSVGKPISVFTKDKKWFAFAHSSKVANKSLFKMIRLSNGNFWAIAPRKEGGIYAFDTNNTPLNLSDDKHRFFTPQTSKNERTNDVRSIAQDQDGTVWIGTDQGIFTYSYPDKVFETKPYADRIQITTVDADTSEQYLLKTEMVTTIAIDQANRKWIGTRRAGIFLTSPSGKETILSFNTENSPLPSNTINDIKIDHKTGRVFIATAKGLLSYRAEATNGSEYFQNVYAFPNPVRPEYQGVITITGLMNDTFVKITDVTGGLVYETKSTGGQAIWHGRNMHNERVSTGVYLIFCSNADGSETHVTKLLFIK